MSTMHLTRHDADYQRWFHECAFWWECEQAEEATDHPAMEWRAWYDEGLTVRQAMDRATEWLYGK